jgi:hypothetical protein
VLQLPPWAGSTLVNLHEVYNLPSSILTVDKTNLTEAEKAAYFQVRDRGFSDTNFGGYFIINTRYYTHEKDFTRSCFIFDERVVSFFKNALIELN